MDYGKLAQTLTVAEGDKPSAYQDSMGYWTIGVGHLIDARKGGRLSEAAIQFILKEDMANALDLCVGKPWYLALDTDARQRAVVELAFILGRGLYSFSSFLTLLQQKNFVKAAIDLENTAIAKQLPNRIPRIAKMIETGNDV